jgi:hypothetical protein
LQGADGFGWYVDDSGDAVEPVGKGCFNAACHRRAGLTAAGHEDPRGVVEHGTQIRTWPRQRIPDEREGIDSGNSNIPDGAGLVARPR